MPDETGENGMEMRRKDRQVNGEEALREILEACQVVRIAMQDEEGLYIVPMNFGYDYENGKLALYVHSAREGRKVSAFRRNGQIAFEMDCGHELVEGNQACQYSYRYKSIVGNGEIVELENPEDKTKGLQALMRRFSDRTFDFNEKMLAVVSVFRIDASGFTGKSRV